MQKWASESNEVFDLREPKKSTSAESSDFLRHPVVTQAPGPMLTASYWLCDCGEVT